MLVFSAIEKSCKTVKLYILLIIENMTGMTHLKRKVFSILTWTF